MIKRKIRIYLSLLLILLIGGACTRVVMASNLMKLDHTQKNFMPKPQVMLETTKGNILLELNTTAAPITVKNFITYVNNGFYNGLIFHRVIPNFMIQGGGMQPDMSSPVTRTAIKNEANNGLSNSRGTIAMARTNNPNSATSQFFINVANNTFLDAGVGKAGYTVFGRVIDGMNVVNAISRVKTMTYDSYSDVPEHNIKIIKAEVIAKGKKATSSTTNAKKNNIQ